MEAGEKVVWTWDSVVQFITILLPERHQQKLMAVEMATQTEESQPEWPKKVERRGSLIAGAVPATLAYVRTFRGQTSETMSWRLM